MVRSSCRAGADPGVAGTIGILLFLHIRPLPRLGLSVSTVFSVISLLLLIYLIILIARIGLDVLRYFARDWRPSGVVLVLAVGVYGATDPVLRAIRRVIPPLRIGQFALDIGYTLLFFVVYIAYRTVPAG